ncbi:MAG: formate dehydrogenase accessory sulfurtransferase FdhD [Caulobacterales bacterium]|nr:formate dehydrogenase accessory sulfurtransferase FdhD [Caulobacterales bacterium]MCA0373540.1 formate dehydrogenase accessory sulfurtransferase FdhD [Pseudomonadota bacterium]
MNSYKEFENTKFIIGQGWNNAKRNLANEIAIAITYNGTTHAIMMASPNDLEDYAIGFSFCEGIIKNKDEIEKIEIINHNKGLELRIRLQNDVAANFTRQRNLKLGPVGCGLCGIDSLDAALPNLEKLETNKSFEPQIIINAMAKMREFQIINKATNAAHAAGFMDENGDVILVREDIGRHNALDKLNGALLVQNIDAQKGAILMTSRLSIDLVQKCAAIKCANLCAISAPSRLAIDAARQANIKIYAIVRDDGLEVF